MEIKVLGIGAEAYIVSSAEFALLQPNGELKALQVKRDWTQLMVVQEGPKTAPSGNIWVECYHQCDVSVDGEWYDTVKGYKKRALRYGNDGHFVSSRPARLYPDVHGRLGSGLV